MGMLLRNILRYLAGGVFGILLVKGGFDMDTVKTVVQTIGDDPEIAGSVAGIVAAGVEIYRKLRVAKDAS